MAGFVRRILRSGQEFSAFLALTESITLSPALPATDPFSPVPADFAIQASEAFNVQQCLREPYEREEPASDVHSLPLWMNPTLADPLISSSAPAIAHATPFTPVSDSSQPTLSVPRAGVAQLISLAATLSSLTAAAFAALSFITPAAATPIPSPHRHSPSASSPGTSAPSKAKSAAKAASKQRKKKKLNRLLAAAAVAGSAPPVKHAARVHRNLALSHPLLVNSNMESLARSKPAWIGSRRAQDGSRVLRRRGRRAHLVFTPHGFSDGVGGRVYTREEIFALIQAGHLRLVSWSGRQAVPIVDSKRRIIGVLGGMPKDLVAWKGVTDRAAELMETGAKTGAFTSAQIHHRRAQVPYPSISRGVSHGGGQTEPGELQNNVANTELTDTFLAEECFQRLAGFANSVFLLFAPALYMYYQTQLAALKAWRFFRWNFAKSVFAACTFNFGPQAITVPHLDFANLSWGWCSITALGCFDADYGGHLILWDLGLVLRFPPGATILIPSALIRHSNVPIRPTEQRYSFTQYTAGGLFRWIRHGFKSEEEWKAGATKAQWAQHQAEGGKRWKDGVAMFSTVEELVAH